MKTTRILVSTNTVGALNANAARDPAVAVPIPGRDKSSSRVLGRVEWCFSMMSWALFCILRARRL